MFKFSLLILLIIILTSCSNKECILKDGNYTVEFDNEFGRHEIEIWGDSIKHIYRDNFDLAEFENVSKNEFLFNDLMSYLIFKEDSLKNQYTFGAPYYRLNNCNNDTIEFKLMRNDSTEINSGVLTLIKR